MDTARASFYLQHLPAANQLHIQVIKCNNKFNTGMENMPKCMQNGKPRASFYLQQVL